MNERVSTSEVVADVTRANEKAVAEMTAATVEVTKAASDIAAATASATAVAAVDIAEFYLDCTERFITLCDGTRNEVQSNLTQTIEKEV